MLSASRACASFCASLGVFIAVAMSLSAAQAPPPVPPRVDAGGQSRDQAGLWLAGIIEIPQLFGSPAPDASVVDPGATSPILLRRQPGGDTVVVAEILSAAAIESAEYDYEASGALVYARDGGWSLVRTTDGTTGWLAPGDGGSFHALEALLDGALAFLTGRWDGALSDSPGGAGRSLPGDPRRRIVGYLEPQIGRTRVVLRPGDDPDALRDRYRASASSLRTQPDGTRILDLETGTAHPLFERRDRASAMADAVDTNRSGHVLATTTSVPARVPVFSRSAGWFEVALRRDRWQDAPRVWLEDTPAWRFQPITDESDGERFMVRVWGETTRSVRVIGFQHVGVRLWAEAEVHLDSPCDAAGEPAVVARGWMPVHAPSGEPAIWFRSRGC